VGRAAVRDTGGGDMSGSTRLTMYYFNAGLADREATAQFSQAFEAFVREGDPGWGDVALAAGMHGTIMEPHKGDLNLYWWWSGSDNADWLEYYCDRATVRPAAILCTSRKMEDHARKRGFKAIYLPVATGPDYQPLDRPRVGTCYCGTPGHKDNEQERCIIAPARARGNFSWWTIVGGGRPELNERYARSAVCLGMTAAITLQWGIVPQRTYEVLAGANPYVTYRHWAMDDELGFPYPYQSASPEETVAWIEELTNHYDAHRAEFARYGEIVRQNHTWDWRVRMLAKGLEEL
jgi:hypothetical protein